MSYWAEMLLLMMIFVAFAVIAHIMGLDISPGEFAAFYCLAEIVKQKRGEA
jgi:uncharacterized membrane protein YhaH (DUF805 family)